MPGSLLLSTAALALWLALLFLLDRASLRRLWLPRFWLVTLIFAMASGFFLGPRAARGTWSVLSYSGLQAGLLMVVRGAFIFGLASWASRALGRNVQQLAARLGVPRLGTALTVAFELLPELESSLRAALAKPPAGGTEGREGRGLRRYYGVAVQVIASTAELAGNLALRSSRAERARRQCVAVVGPPRSGKTTLLTRLTGRLRARGLRVGGITQPTVDESSLPEGYRLRAVATGEERPFARRRAKASAQELGFSFDEAAWSWARQRIRQDRTEMEVVVVDELGKLEARGEGHLPALLEDLEAERRGVLVLGVRADCASAIQARLGTFLLTVAPTSDPAGPDRLADQIARACVRPSAMDDHRGSPKED